MQLIEKLDMRHQTETSKEKRRYGLFLCPACETGVEMRADCGSKAKSCKACANISTGVKNITHGGSSGRMYRVWHGMRQRCNNKVTPYYKDYGGRGISVCSEWSDFEAFRDWAIKSGYSSNLTIDRIDNDGNYSPDNCRFTTQPVQARNTRLLRSTNTSGYRGVSWYKRHNKWKARIVVDYNDIHLGYFDLIIDAAKSYNKFVIDNNLEHTLNNV